MKQMRLLPMFMALLLICGILGISLVSCKGANHAGDNAESLANAAQVESEEAMEEIDEDGDTADVYEYVPPVIPSFIKEKFGNTDWCVDTICVVGNKVFYMAYSDYGNSSVIYNEDRIFTYDPTLTIDSFASGCKYKFYVGIAGKTMLVDFSDANSLRALPSLSKELPSFTSYSLDSIAGFGNSVSYSITVDFPKSSNYHAKEIGRWLVDKVADSQQLNEDIPMLNAIYIGYSKRSNGGWKYKGDINDHKKIAQSAASFYFAMIKGEWGTNDEDYPLCLFSTLNLKARVYNNKFVTYQQYTHDYNGGAHGYYTERLISYDHVHQQNIDFDYLFNLGCKEELLKILLEVAKDYPQYDEWEPNIEEYVCVTDDKGNTTGELRFPQPGLSDKGVVFSFQPYDISCFAAGCFHYTIPYGKIKHLLTPRGKWCVGVRPLKELKIDN